MTQTIKEIADFMTKPCPRTLRAIRIQAYNQAIDDAVDECKGYGDDDLAAKSFAVRIRALKKE